MASGFTLDDVLDMTFDQIGLASRAILRHKLRLVEEVVGPVLGVSGAGYKRPKVNQPKVKKTTSPQSDEQRAAKEHAMLSAIGSAGFRVRTAKSAID